MRYDKSYLRKKSLLKRKKKYSKTKKFNFNLIFALIKKHFKNKKIIIGCYYPSNYEVDTLRFIKEAQRRNFTVALPVIKPSNEMSFKSWELNEPLYVNEFGMLEPKSSKKSIIPDFFIVPLVAFDNNLNRIGYGKGYYDRSLRKISKLKKNIVSLGAAYSFQRCKKIPIDNYDFKLNYIFTERGIINPY
jgi:5-formyltetrahydrofolate cyclo-ligase